MYLFLMYTIILGYVPKCQEILSKLKNSSSLEPLYSPLYGK